MKFVKRISLFFIYPMTMFSIGFAANMVIMEFFYPGEKLVAVEPDKGEDSMQVSVLEKPVMDANTLYIVQAYNTRTGEVAATEETAPDKYMGLTREQLVWELDSYNQNPSLTDLEKGFAYAELVSFSSERVVVRKSYEPEEEKGFFLLNEDHKVIVYNYNLESVYMITDILVEELPEGIQEEILHMKYMENESELFNFLESYSS